MRKVKREIERTAFTVPRACSRRLYILDPNHTSRPRYMPASGDLSAPYEPRFVPGLSRVSIPVKMSLFMAPFTDRFFFRSVELHRTDCHSDLDHHNCCPIGFP